MYMCHHDDDDDDDDDDDEGYKLQCFFWLQVL